MSIRYYAIPASASPVITVGGNCIRSGGEVSIVSHPISHLSEVEEYGVQALARLVYFAAHEVNDTLRKMIKEHSDLGLDVAVLTHQPLAVFAADDPGGVVYEGDEDERKPVIGADGKPLVRQPSVGYIVECIVSVVGSSQAIEVDFPYEDVEPTWMTVPDLDKEALDQADIDWKSAKGRQDVVRLVLGQSV